MNLLHVAAEVFPYVKTGGLADVVAALPAAQRSAGDDARILLPGYPAMIDAMDDVRVVCDIGPAFGAARVRLLQGMLRDSRVPAYAIDAPLRYRRTGGPYQQASGAEWADNLERFALLGWVGAQLAAGALDDGWSPDVLHAHDWHAGMACAYLHALGLAGRPASVYTVHNLAFPGRFEMADYGLLGLPAAYRGTDGLEFHGSLSFMKAGLQLADHITTVSPTYAREIATPAFGCGFEGVIQARASTTSGILNGIDPAVWDPSTDAALPAMYDTDSLAGKAACKQAVQAAFGLDPFASAPLLCIVSRLTGQKGIDLVLAALPTLLTGGAQLIVLGTGEPELEEALRAVAAEHPQRIAVQLAYDEDAAHRIIAGSDAILVPSRFEPCGLTQLYGLRYGTLPVVHRTGGLADTVIDAGDPSEARDIATGFWFEQPTVDSLSEALQRTIAAYRNPALWRRLMTNAMNNDASWATAAKAYGRVYRHALAAVGPV